MQQEKHRHRFTSKLSFHLIIPKHRDMLFIVVNMEGVSTFDYRHNIGGTKCVVIKRLNTLSYIDCGRILTQVG